ncbi:MAG TPA: hypothetical protein VIJ75_17855 [Hanamia sp.]
MIELKEGTSLVYDDLTIVHIDGGHKITMDEKGKRSGDLSFAEVMLQTPDVKSTKVRFYHPEGKKNGVIEFGSYAITVKEVAWNGVFVMLDIRKK